MEVPLRSKKMMLEKVRENVVQLEIEDPMPSEY
jgi:hypothetical protein